MKHAEAGDTIPSEAFAVPTPLPAPSVARPAPKDKTSKASARQVVATDSPPPASVPVPVPLPVPAPVPTPAAAFSPKPAPAVPKAPAKPDTLVITDLAKRYSEATVFENVSLRVKSGEFVAILGESGVGKSTLLNCMAGLDAWDSGNVVVAGTDMASLDDTARALFRREKIGFVFQAFHVLPHLDVAQNIALPLMLLNEALAQKAERAAAMTLTQSGALNAARLGAVTEQQTGRPSPPQRWLASLRRAWANRGQADWSRDPRITAMLDAVGLQGLGNRLPQQLSGGQLQRVAIARALIHRPTLVLADEPTGNLDPDTAAMVMDILSIQAREHGASVVLVTHSQASAARADRVCTLKVDGIFKRPPIYRRPKSTGTVDVEV